MTTWLQAAADAADAVDAPPPAPPRDEPAPSSSSTGRSTPRAKRTAGRGESKRRAPQQRPKRRRREPNAARDDVTDNVAVPCGRGHRRPLGKSEPAPHQRRRRHAGARGGGASGAAAANEASLRRARPARGVGSASSTARIYCDSVLGFFGCCASPSPLARCRAPIAARYKSRTRSSVLAPFAWNSARPSRCPCTFRRPSRSLHREIGIDGFKCGDPFGISRSGADRFVCPRRPSSRPARAQWRALRRHGEWFGGSAQAAAAEALPSAEVWVACVPRRRRRLARPLLRRRRRRLVRSHRQRGRRLPAGGAADVSSDAVSPRCDRPSPSSKSILTASGRVAIDHFGGTEAECPGGRRRERRKSTAGWRLRRCNSLSQVFLFSCFGCSFFPAGALILPGRIELAACKTRASFFVEPAERLVRAASSRRGLNETQPPHRWRRGSALSSAPAPTEKSSVSLFCDCRRRVRSVVHPAGSSVASISVEVNQRSTTV